MNRIKFLREELGWTQVFLADRIGISRQVLSNYENEINQPSPELLIKFADTFECSIDYLLGRADDFGVISLQPKSTTSSLTKDEQELLNDYRSLAPYLQEMLRATIQTWKDAKANAETKNRRA